MFTAESLFMSQNECKGPLICLKVAPDWAFIGMSLICLELTQVVISL